VTSLRLHLDRRRALVLGGVLAVVVIAAVLLVVNPFSSTPASGSALDNGSATTTQRITQQDLTSQTQVSATLGYADASSIAVPSGTAPASVQQAQQSASSAQATLETAQATLAADQKALEQARAALAADRSKQAVDCSGANAAQAGGGTAGEGACAADGQTVTTDEQAVTASALKVASDQNAAASAQTALAGAQQALAVADASAATYGQTSVYTMLAKVGDVVARGGTLYAIAGEPVLLLYGGVTPYRAFTPGMSSGSDVAELNANLTALGYGQPPGDSFTSATAAGIDALQRAHGLPATGQLLLGSVAFEPGAVRVTAVTPTVGATVQAGAVLSVTSTRRVVTIALDASQQTSVKVGDPVSITLPDNSTTPGHVTYVGTVATAPSSDQGGPSSPTIEVDVTPDRPGATGRLDQAPVDVSITTASVKNVLVVPVNALLALASGGYAVEEVESDGSHRLVGASVGLFDDSLGLVQVSGAGLAGGQRVVVPAS
jgi:hypothetical protein